MFSVAKCKEFVTGRDELVGVFFARALAETEEAVGVEGGGVWVDLGVVKDVDERDADVGVGGDHPAIGEFDWAGGFALHHDCGICEDSPGLV